MSQPPISDPLAAEPTTTATGGKPYTAPQRQVWGWGVGKIAEYGLVAMFGQALNIFTVGFGLNPVIVGWCVMLPRVVDGIVDPMIGHWSDETRTRWGRRKPFMVFGAFAGATFLAALWWTSPHWSSSAQFIYLGVVGCLLYLCYGSYVMAWNAIGYELSDDYHERSRIQAVAGFFSAGMSLLFSWIYWLALRPVFGGVVWGMRWIGAVVALMIIVSSLVAVFSAKERFSHVNRTHVSLLPALRTALKNRPFVILILMKLFEIFGARLVGGLYFFLSVYYVCHGDQNLGTKITGIGATLGAIWSFAVLPFVKPVSKWIGKRGALILAAGLNFLGGIIYPLMTVPGYPYLSLVPTLVLMPVIALSVIIAGAILPDICDVDELETGQRREGLFTAVMAFVAKIEISLAVVLIGYLVSWSGLDTKIATRWTDAAAGKATAKFSAGERAVFSFKDGQAATFDTFAMRGDVETVELFAGDESPANGFQSLGKFQAHDTDTATPEEWKFPPVTAKYFKVELTPGDNSGRKATVQEVRLTNAGVARNLLAAENGAKVSAAEPPNLIGRRFYWIVMIPGIVFTGLTFLMTILFPLTEEKMKVVRQKLDEMRIAKAAAGLPTDEVAEEFVHEHPNQTAKFVHEHPDIVEEIKDDEPPQPSDGGDI